MKRGFCVHHNGPPAKCLGRPHSRCQAYWDAVRDFHVNGKGWSDIAYSFGVCPHGTLFTGRGWFKNQFANGSDVVGTYDGKDSEWYTVLVFLGWEPGPDGQPVDEEPTPEMERAVAQLIDFGRTKGYCGQRVLPHNAFKVKRCPGARFTFLASQWDLRPLDTYTTVLKEDPLAALTDSEQRELLDRLRMLTPFGAERINRSGVRVPEGGFLAHPTVRYAMDTLRGVQALDLSTVTQAVETAIANVDVGEATAAEIAAEVLAQLKEAL